MRTIIRKLNHNPISSSKASWVGTVTPRKQRDENFGVRRENVEPPIAFSKLPPGPPFIGSLIALFSTLDMWIKREKGDD